jgi:IPT/TIG domain
MANGDAQKTPQGATGMGPALNSTSVRLSSAFRNRLGIYFVCLAVLTFYVLIATWPVVGDDGASFAEARVFGFRLRATPDARLFITVVAAGAVGSLVHCLTSFADYVGNRSLKRSWVWYLVLRTPIGIALALLFYVVLRGGLIAPTLTSTATDSGSKSHAWTLLNPYGLAAIAAMAGMFSKQATDKLSELFDTLFKTDNPVDRRDPLNQPPVISSADPASLTVGGAVELAILGQNFSKDCAALINGETRDVKWQSDTRLTITLLPKDVEAAGDMLVVVRNPSSAGGDSKQFTVPVRAA